MTSWVYFMTPQLTGSLILTVQCLVDHEHLSTTINILLLNVGDDNIEDGQDFFTSVALGQHGKDNGLGHNNEEQCCELWVPSLYSYDMSWCYLEVEQITIQFDHIYSRVIELNPIRSLCHELAHTIDEFLITTALLGDVIKTLIIADPECNIPGLIICPTVILSSGQICLASGSRLWSWVLVKNER